MEDCTFSPILMKDVIKTDFPDIPNFSNLLTNSGTFGMPVIDINNLAIRAAQEMLPNDQR